MAFKLSTVEVESKKSHEIKQTNRGKKFTIAQEKLGKLSITDRYNNQIGTFDAQGNEYKFKHKNSVEWTITTGKEWKLLHKGEPVAVVSNPEKEFHIKLLGTKYGAGDVWVGFDDTNTSFKLERGERDDGSAFAVYRSDSGKIGTSGGKVEIARGERRNFVIVLACLVLFVKQKVVKKSQRQSMPVGSSLGIAAEAQSKTKRGRSNSVDGDGKASFTAKKSGKVAKESEKSDDVTKSGSKNDEKKTEKKPSTRDIKKNNENRSKTSTKKRHTKGKGKHGGRGKRHDTSGSSEESGSSYTRSGSDYSTSETSYTDSDQKYSARKRRSEKGRKSSPRKATKAKGSNADAKRGKGRSETPRGKKDAADSEKTKSSEPASSSEPGLVASNSVKAKLMQVAESLEKGGAPNGNSHNATATLNIGAEIAPSEVSTNGSGTATTTATITIPALPQPGILPGEPTPVVPVSAATAVIVALSDNQYLLNINGLDRSKKSNISIQLKVDGVPVAGSPWEYTV